MMEFSSILILLCSVVTLQLFQSCESTTVVVDGVSQWNSPHLQIGDSVSKFSFRFFFFYLDFEFRPTNLNLLCVISQFSSTKIITVSTFSETGKPSLSATSLKLHS